MPAMASDQSAFGVAGMPRSCARARRALCSITTKCFDRRSGASNILFLPSIMRPNSLRLIVRTTRIGSHNQVPYMDFNPLDLILHLDVYLDMLVTHYGTWVYAILFLVIFCETGLVVTPFLPGDSLLFIAGAVAAGGAMDPVLLACLLMAAAILGDSTNYVIGRTLGDRLFRNPDSKIFRRDYLIKTQEFYERHGGKTVTLARFLPIIRTFAPFVAGVGKMHYLRFLSFSVLGSVLWVGGLVALGFFFGNIPFIKKNLTLLVLAIILISLLPMIIGLVRTRMGRSAEAR